MKKFSILGLLLAILGIAGPIAWDYYKTKLEIELKLVDHSEIITPLQKLDGLKIMYGEEHLNELSKTTFTITNVGRTPIRSEDVIQPISMTFGKEAEVIDVKIDSLKPQNLGASVEFDMSKNEARFRFSLLNPSDVITFGVLSKTGVLTYNAGARIAGISELTIVRDIGANKNKSVTWTAYIVGFFTLFALLISVILGVQAISQIRFKRNVRRGQFELPYFASAESYIKWVNTTFFFVRSQDREGLIQYLRDAPVGMDGLISVEADEVSFFIDGMMKATANIAAFWMTAIPCAVGFWYIYASIR